MPVDLIGSESRWSLNYRTWMLILKLGQKYGWQPAGTQPSADFPDYEWDGGYIVGIGEVMREDAMALADALKRALPDIPELDKTATEEVHARLTAITWTAIKAEAVANREKLDADDGQVVYIGGMQCVKVIPKVAELQIKLWLDPPVSEEDFVRLFTGADKEKIEELVVFLRNAVQNPLSPRGTAFEIT